MLKKIKGKKYAYLVESKWDSKKKIWKKLIAKLKLQWKWEFL